MTKAQILKIANAKDEASFYELFPTEEAFMAKHGGDFRKAQIGLNIPNIAQTIQQQTQSYGVNADDYPGANSWALANQQAKVFDPNGNIEQMSKQGIQSPNIRYDTPQNPMNQKYPMGNVGQQWGNSNPLPEGISEGIPENIGWTPQYQTKQPNAGMKALEQLPMVGQIFGGLSALDAEKEQRRQATQMRMVSDIALKASGTRPEKRERKWVRPEDNIVDGNALFPVNGVGTNVLTKHGGNIQKNKKAQTGAALNNFGSMGFSSTSGLSSMSGGASATPWGAIGQVGGKMAGTATGDNAGGSIGGGIGGAIGSIWGPAGQAIGQIGGTLIGGLLDKNPKRIKREQEATMRNTMSMALNNAAPSVQAGYASYLEKGGSIYANGGPIDGELQLYEGNAETMSNNPYLPGQGETVMFRGPSHAEGGMDISYGGNPVEVEGGETGTVLPSSEGGENLTIYGDIPIPFGEHKGTKFKNAIANLSKKENKYNKMLEKFSDSKDPLHKGIIMGADNQLKAIATEKMELAELQKAINNTAEELGNVDPVKMLKGKLVPNKIGGKLAKYGKTTTDETTKIPESDVTEADALRYVPSGQHNNGMYYGKVNQQMFEETKQENPWYDWDTFNPKDKRSILHYQNEFNRLAKSIGSRAYIEPDGLFGEQTASTRIGVGNKPVTSIGVGGPDKLNLAPGQTAKTPIDNQYGVIPYKRNPWIDGFNTVLPFLRPTDQEPLDGNQLLGEMYAMSNNQLEPVQAQTYQPDLGIPYDISYQDQLNANQADYRSMQRMVGYNPAAQGALNAQKYEANSKVLAEQFRANQAMKDRVYGENRNTLNDAKLKNLGIYDQQYTRQAQALSNTKATSQAVLNSISDKIMKNKLENRILGVYENMYNYRYDAAGRAINMNPLFQPNIPQKYAPQGDPNYIPVTDKDGNITEYKYIGEPKYKTPGINPNAKHGKSLKSTLNSSIVKAYKNI